MSSSHDTPSLTLRNLPLAARLTLALFLISAGLGYFAGLVQLHFTHAKGGSALPGLKETVETYHGPLDDAAPISRLEKLLVTQGGPFSGTGTMRPAFFERSGDWEEKRKEKGEEQLRKEREAEVEAVLYWIRNGASKEAYDAKLGDEPIGKLVLPPELSQLPMSSDYSEMDNGRRVVYLRRLIQDRCATCHMPESKNPGSGHASSYPLQDYEQIAKYTKVQPRTSALSLEKLAMTTHAHWLSFAMLFLLTGLIFSFTSYPKGLRCFFGPLTLLVQMIDISCWWLARFHPFFGYAIPVTGAIVGASLAIQILGSLFNMFGTKGRLVLLVLIFVGWAIGGWIWIGGVEPYLQQKAIEARKR